MAIKVSVNRWSWGSEHNKSTKHLGNVSLKIVKESTTGKWSVKIQSWSSGGCSLIPAQALKVHLTRLKLTECAGNLLFSLQWSIYVSVFLNVVGIHDKDFSYSGRSVGFGIRWMCLSPELLFLAVWHWPSYLYHTEPQGLCTHIIEWHQGQMGEKYFVYNHLACRKFSAEVLFLYLP